MSRHIGNIVENAVRKSEYPISRLAKRIGYTRQHMYNIFQQHRVDLALVEEIGKVIGHDFSEEIRTLKKYQPAEPEVYTSVKEMPGAYEKLEKKYIALLEEHNRLLKEYTALLKKNKE